MKTIPYNKTNKTGYNNFIYLAADDDKIKDKNPKDHPEAFGPVLNQ